MTAGVVWIDHFEGLEKAVICFSGEVACDLGCQDVEVRISGCQLLHGFQIQLQDDRSMGCSRWRCPARWTMKRWGTHSGRRCSGRRAWSSGGRDVVAGHGSLMTISIQVNAERHNKIADGMCTMKVQKVQGVQRCNNGWDNGNKMVSGWKYTFATWNGETYTAAVRRWWNVSVVNPFFRLHISGTQPSVSLSLFHIERTSASDLPILVEITRHENRDFSSDFKVRSFCFSSAVQLVKGLGERDLDCSWSRRRFAGALGVALAFCLRFGGVDAVVEIFDGSGRASGGGAATCWCGSGRLGSNKSSIRASSSAWSGEGRCTASIKALVWSE